MRNSPLKLLLALLAAFALLATACGDDDDTSAGADEGTDTSEDTSEETAGDLPGEGVSLRMARADWSTGYIQAEIFRQVLTELGYDVSDPAELELGPSNAYTAMAEGDFDLWTNSWYPGHASWLENELPDGSIVGDHVEAVGKLMPGSGVQGFLVTKSVAEEHGITSMQQIHDDPELVELFDGDGNGKADLYGCQESYTCDDIINNQLAYYGWDNFEQKIAAYDALFAEATGLVEDGEPAIVYTWTPSAYITQLVPGENVLWLTMHPTDILDDSNPAGLDGGESHDQRPGFDGFSETQCTQPCQLGWLGADITVTARSDVLEANPPLQALFEAAQLSLLDISLAIVEMDNGDGSQDHVVDLATRWIEDNRDTVDEWIAVAMAAA